MCIFISPIPIRPASNRGEEFVKNLNFPRMHEIIDFRSRFIQALSGYQDQGVLEYNISCLDTTGCPRIQYKLPGNHRVS